MFTPYEIPGKSWGTELVIARTDQYLGKLLLMRAGGSGALQYHETKDETFFIYSGVALLRYPDAEGTLQCLTLNAGMAIYVPPGAVHQVEALEDCVIMETSTPVFEDRVKV